MKKILYIIDSMHQSAGMERVVSNKARFLSLRGYQVTIMTLNQRNRPYYYSIPDKVIKYDLGINFDEYNNNNAFVKVLRYLYKYRVFQKRISQYLNENPQDIVITLSKRTIETLIKEPHDYKLIFEHHFNRYYDENSSDLFAHSAFQRFVSKIRTRKYNQLYKKVDKFVVLTDEDKQLWGDTYKNIVVIPNSIDYDINETAELNSNIVIAVGRLENQKGFDLLIKAWSIVKRTNYNWVLHIYGSGSQYGNLLGLIRDNGLENSVKIFPPTKEIKEKLRAASVFVLSSRYEGLPMVMLESMSIGLPCVSFKCKTGPSDIIDEMKNGLLCEEGNVEQLSNRLLLLINDQNLRKTLGYNAHIKMEQYSHEIIANKWINLFENL